MNTLNQVKQQTQKGFTFVELLIIMIVVAILSGIGIQFVLSTQEDKARLTNAKAFLIKDVPTAIYSCLLRLDTITSCDATTLISENLDAGTEWNDETLWVIAGSRTGPGTESIVLCYPLGDAGDAANEARIGLGLETYMNNNGDTAAFAEYDAGVNPDIRGVGLTGCPASSVAVEYRTRQR